MKAR
ncbi:UNVERIFIED_CONTAM: hypothetical protein GTU68_032264 [Idotea baltica]|jgi:hypothetical protein